MTVERSRILLYAGTGYKQQSLVTLLQSMPKVDVVVMYKLVSVSALVKGFSPDVVLIDASIPDVGRELVRKDVRQQCPGIPCVLLTDCLPSALREIPDLSTLDDVICKDESVSKLITQIQRIIRDYCSSNGGKVRDPSFDC